MYEEALVPVAALAAVSGTTVIPFNDFGPDSALQGSCIETMATAAAVSRARAIEVSSALHAGRSVSFCTRNSVLPGDERLPDSVLNPYHAPLPS